MDFVAGLSAAAEPRENSIPDRTVHPFLWSVRRELWENRSVWLVPIIVGIVEVVGFAFSAIGLPERRRAVLLLDIAQQRARIEPPYNIAAVMMMFSALMVGLFYCADALHSERRDRSILFWKSLPVSDLGAVLAKTTVALVIIPLVAWAITVCVHLSMLAMTDTLLFVHRVPLTNAAQLPLTFNWLVLFYGLAAVSVWQAPIYAWLLLVSAWARRATLLWAVLPLIALSVFERITFGTNYVGVAIKNRAFGFAPQGFDFHGHHTPVVTSLAQLTPGSYLRSPALWSGLLFAAIFLAGAIQLRRYKSAL